MSARLLIIFFLSAATLLQAARADEAAQDMELFEFIAMFDAKDNIYIETEMDDVKTNAHQTSNTAKVNKSESNEK